jgi:hypothetical protein
VTDKVTVDAQRLLRALDAVTPHIDDTDDRLKYLWLEFAADGLYVVAADNFSLCAAHVELPTTVPATELVAAIHRRDVTLLRQFVELAGANPVVFHLGTSEFVGVSSGAGAKLMLPRPEARYPVWRPLRDTPYTEPALTKFVNPALVAKALSLAGHARVELTVPGDAKRAIRIHAGGYAPGVDIDVLVMPMKAPAEEVPPPPEPAPTEEPSAS